VAYQSTPNLLPVDGGEIMWTGFIAPLLAAGWLRYKDSDGTTYSAAGAQVTHKGSGANGLNNTSAWTAIKSADGKIYLCLKHGGVNNNWSLTIAVAPLNAGAPDATTTPDTTVAADHQLLWGTGTAAAPVPAAFHSGTNSVYRQNVYADYAGSGFWVEGHRSGVAPDFVIRIDPLLDADPADVFPWVVHCHGSTASANAFDATNVLSSSSAGVGFPKKWFKYGLSGQAFVTAPMLAIYSEADGVRVYPNGCAANPYDTSKEPLVDILYARDSALGSPGPVGRSSLFKWAGVSRSTGESYGGKTYVRLGDVAAKWDGSTTVNP
jgi:hypothetical protein